LARKEIRRAERAFLAQGRPPGGAFDLSHHGSHEWRLYDRQNWRRSKRPLCTILGAISLPDCDESKLINLREYVVERLGANGARSADAIDDLRAVFDLRV
jgi:hypothetical protein